MVKAITLLVDYFYHSHPVPVEVADAAVDCDKLFLLDPAEEEDRLLELEDLEDDVGLSFEDEEDRCFEEDILV